MKKLIVQLLTLTILIASPVVSMAADKDLAKLNNYIQLTDGMKEKVSESDYQDVLLPLKKLAIVAKQKMINVGEDKELRKVILREVTCFVLGNREAIVNAKKNQTYYNAAEELAAR